MNRKLLICLVICYFTIDPIQSEKSATKNCQSEIATSDYENFYQIKCGNTNGNELNVNVYVDDPSEVNILLASNNRYENEDKDNYEFAIVDGVPMIALGSEPKKMNEQADASEKNGRDTSPGSSPKKINIQVQSGTIKVNVLGKTYSYKLPKVVNVKYLSFADFTGKKNAFYFNCPDDCANNKNNAHNRSFLRRRWDQIKSWFKRK